jgi:hypothetical protein
MNATAWAMGGTNQPGGALARPCQHLRAATFAWGLALITPLVAGVLHVSSTQTTNDPPDGLTWQTAFTGITAAMEAASAGDEVWVAAGTYSGTIILRSGVHLMGGFGGWETEIGARDWRQHPVILDGAKQGPVVVVAVGAVPKTRLDGFTLQNGVSQYGGGIVCVDASLTAANLTITGNRAMFNGGGLVCRNGELTLTTSEVRANQASRGGGGAYCYNIRATLSYCRFDGNSAGEAGVGGGIQLANPEGIGPDTQQSAVTITGCMITENLALGGGGIACDPGSIASITGNFIGYNQSIAGSGGGIECMMSSPVIRGNRLVGNRVTPGGIGGGGISVYRQPFGGGDAAPLIENNVLLLNVAAPKSGWTSAGGGIYCSPGTAPVIRNNTLVSNQASAGGGIASSTTEAIVWNNLISHHTTASSIIPGTASHNCFFGDADDLVAMGLADDGNFIADPRFTSNLSYGDVRLRADSPCRDAGRHYDVDQALDMDGEPRLAGDGIDIGADEIHEASATRPAVILHVRPDGSDTQDGASWSTALRSPQTALDRLAAGGGEIWVAEGLYPARELRLRDFCYLYGGFLGSETTRETRDWAARYSVLEGGEVAGVVVATNTSSWCALDGFTVQNGFGTGGGGISLISSACIVANNRVLNNRGQVVGGIYISTTNAGTVPEPLVTNNFVASNRGSVAGGIGCFDTPARVVNNRVVSNRVEQVGAGAMALGSCGGVKLSRSGALVQGNLIAGNVNTLTGNQRSVGGLYSLYSAATRVVNNTIIGNSVPPDSLGAGGLCLELGQGSLVANNLISHNSSGVRDVGNRGNLQHNCVFGNGAEGQDYLGDSNPTGTHGNLAVDPRLGEPSSHELRPDSPCIDAGADIYADLASHDLDGDVRRHGAAVDIGADESTIGPAWRPWFDPSPGVLQLSVTEVGGITYALLDVTLPDRCHQIISTHMVPLAGRLPKVDVRLIRADDGECAAEPESVRRAAVLGALPAGNQQTDLYSWGAPIAVWSWSTSGQSEPTLADLTSSSTGDLSFQVLGIAEADYVVERCFALNLWSAVHTNLGAPFVFATSTPSEPGTVFYRVQVRGRP